MKKARIMLTAIAAVAIVSGALALRAKTPFTIWYTGVNSHCTLSFTDPTVPPNPAFLSVTDATISDSQPQDADCTSTIYYTDVE